MRATVFRQVLSASLLLLAIIYPTLACCPAPRLGSWAVNADQAGLHNRNFQAQS